MILVSSHLQIWRIPFGTTTRTTSSNALLPLVTLSSSEKKKLFLPEKTLFRGKDKHVTLFSSERTIH